MSVCLTWIKFAHSLADINYCEANLKLIQDDALYKTYVGSFNIWLKPKRYIAKSILKPSKDVISFLCQPFDLALKSSNTRNNNGLVLITCSKLSSRSLTENSNSYFAWLWNLYRLMKLKTFLLITTSTSTNFMHSEDRICLKLSKAANYYRTEIHTTAFRIRGMVSSDKIIICYC